MAEISLERDTKEYPGGVVAVEDLTLTIREGGILGRAGAAGFGGAAGGGPPGPGPGPGGRPLGFWPSRWPAWTRRCGWNYAASCTCCTAAFPSQWCMLPTTRWKR